MRPFAIPSEFELILECARFPPATESRDRIHSLAALGLNWQVLIEIARHHQVIPLVVHGLHASSLKPPPEADLILQQAALANARECFKSIAEISRLVRLFGQQGVEMRVLKGPPLALAAYRDPSLRQAGDIDLLVSRRDIERADQILRSLGYNRTDEAAWMTRRRMHSYIAHQKEFEYDPPASRPPIDLHWRFFRNPWIRSNAGIEDCGLDWINFSSERIPVLPIDRLFLYLAVHGALDGWLRLKWLADIAALLQSFSSNELESILERARHDGALEEVSAAILLANQWLGSPSPPAACLDARNAVVSRIFAFSSRLLVANGCQPDRSQIPSSAWFLHEWNLYPDTHARAELLERSLFRPRLWSRISLPDPLFPLYALLRPFEWVGTRVINWLGGWLRSPTRRLLLLKISDTGILFEALFTLLYFRAALRFASVERLVLWMGKPRADKAAVPAEKAGEGIRRVEWAIGAVARHSPIDFVCFPQALAAFFMLRRRRIPSRLYYGVARQNNRLVAHTWTKANGRTVVGGDVESQFTVLAIFPESWRRGGRGQTGLSCGP